MKLAIHGGTPAVTQDIPDWPPDDREIRHSLEQVIDNHTWGDYHGPATENLCEILCRSFARTHAWTCSSGTIAVELALRGLKIDSGEVILAAYDFPGNYRAIESVGATPHLVDLASDSYSVDLERLENAVNDNTRAMIFSHLHGELTNATQLEKFASENNISLIEDACQVPGAKVDSRPVGSFGDASVFSFGGSKLLTSGRGGCVLTNDRNILQRIKIFSERGNDAFPLSQLQAAAVLPQLESLSAKNRIRVQNFRELARQTKSLNRLRVQDTASRTTTYYKVPIRVPAADRNFIIESLNAEGISCGAGFNGFVQRARSGRCKVTGELLHAKLAVDETLLLHHPFLLGDSGVLEQVAHGLAKVDAAIMQARSANDSFK